MRLKQKAAIIDALTEGADTSNEIADMTGLPVAHVSNYLTELEGDGVVRKTGRWKQFNKRRQRSQCRELVSDYLLRKAL